MYRNFLGISNFVLLSCVLVLLSSCGSLKNIVYFQKAETQYDPTNDLSKHEIFISNNDNLLIMVSAKNSQVADMFNIFKSDHTGNISSLIWQGYLVDESGCINFPQIGKIRLSGLSKSAAIKLLQEKIEEYIKDPVVNIRIMNYKVTVIGEVSHPGVHSINDEKLTIIQALALSGDLTIHGNRRNIMITREVEGQKQIHRVDITSPEIFNSPVYYLQQNDVVYVEPNKARATASITSQGFSFIMSLTSFFLTWIIFFSK